MRCRFVGLLFLMVFWLASCASQHPKVTSGRVGIGKKPQHFIFHPEKGMQTYPTPRQLEGPGYVFAVDSLGVRSRIGDISGQISVVRGREDMGSAVGNYRAESSKAGLLSFLGISVQTERKKAQQISYYIELQDGLREQTDAQPARDLALELIQAVGVDVSVRYYLVRETLSFSRAKIVIGSSEVNMLDDEIGLSDIASASGYSLSQNSDSSFYELNRTWDYSMRFFYKVDEIFATKTKGGGWEYVVRPFVGVLAWE